MSFVDEHHVIAGIYPVADFLAGTAYSDIYNLAGVGHISFIIMKGAGSSGTSHIRIQACSDVTASSWKYIGGAYAKCSSSMSEDTFEAAVHFTAAGFTTAAASNEIYVIDVPAVSVATENYQFVRLRADEIENSPVFGLVFAVLSKLRNAADPQPERIS